MATAENEAGLNYTELDSEAIKNQLIEYLKNTLGWETLTNDEVLAIISNMQASVSQQIIYLLERRAEECYPDTARTLAAIMKIARSLGYIARRKLAAVTRLRFTIEATEHDIAGEILAVGNGASVEFSGTLVGKPVKRSSISFIYTIGGNVYTGQGDGNGNLVGEFIEIGTLNYATGDWYLKFETEVDNTKNITAGYTWLESSHTFDITIPQHTKVSSSEGIPFITKSTVTLPVGQVEIEVDAIQGILQETNYESLGTANQKFFFEMDNPDENYNFVQVNSEDWEIRGTLIYSSKDSKHVAIEVSNEFAGVNIFFGDNLRGKIPETGADIAVQILETEGADGNIYALDDITNIDDTIFDADTAEVTDISVTNVEFAIGGTPEEGIEEIRENAPILYRIGDHVLTTKQDWMDYMNAYPGVYRANVWGEYDSNQGYPNISLANTVNIALLLNDGQVLSDSFKEQLLIDLTNIKEINTHVVLYDTEKVKFIATVNVNAVRRRKEEALKADVEAVIVANGSYENLNVGQAIRESNITKKIDSIDGVNYHHLIFEVYDDTTEGDGGTTYSGTTIIGNIKASTLKVIKKNISGIEVVLGADDGFGNIVGSGISSGSIIYSSGVYSLITSATLNLGEYLILRFEQDKDGDLICRNEQIFDVYKTDVFVNYG